MTEQEAIARYERKLVRQQQMGLLIKCVFWFIVIWAATHWPGHLLIWLFTFAWI
jgi:hypothetical protein